jgi:hypothetical protein
MDHSIERALEMKRLRMEIKQCPADSPERERRWQRIDELLDKHLEAKGAHPENCGCTDCLAPVADVLARRLGDCVDPRDTASEAEFGAMGVEPT